MSGGGGSVNGPALVNSCRSAASAFASPSVSNQTRVTAPVAPIHARTTIAGGGASAVAFEPSLELPADQLCLADPGLRHVGHLRASRHAHDERPCDDERRYRPGYAIPLVSLHDDSC